MPDPVTYSREGDIAVITVDSPPVNALSLSVRRGLAACFEQFAADAAAKAAVLICAGRTFIAGADITEFDKPIEEPWLPKVVHQIEDLAKPVVAAIHGTALGGGLETAMACHYRVAAPTAQVGLPEVSLGLLPGATGTQRLTRLAGVKAALDAMISGKPMPAKAALEKGVIDAIVEGDLKAGAIRYGSELVAAGKGPRKVRDIVVDPKSVPEGFFAEYRKSIARDTRGFFAPEQIVKCVEAAVSLPYLDAVARENELFMQCMRSTHSKAQRHLFFAERDVAKIADVPKDTPLREIKKVAVIGGGTMGGGIAMNFANAGIPVVLKEINQEALDRGLAIIRGNYEGPVKKGKLPQAAMDKCMSLISGTLDYEDVGDADLVIEAVFETMSIKKAVFTELDQVCKKGAILASNTSTLDIDEIAAFTKRPEDVIGLHFFAPANVMTLLEIVRGAKTAKDVIATSMACAKTIRKTGVLVRVCFGFVGNRMFFPYVREAQRMMLEGVPAERIDKVAFDWGMAMGPNGVSDLSGLDVLSKVNKEWKDKPDDPAYCRMIEVLVGKGRLGQKTGAGIYKYEGRNAVPDPEVAALAKSEAAALDVPQLDVSDEEIIERLFYAMVNEGALILDEGIAQRSSDIDVVYCHGYGMPRYRGGPMMYADTVGLDKVLAAIEKYRARYGDQYWTPAPLIVKLAKAGQSFAQWSAAKG
ncbi:MAG: enoyl-CoA hydratase/isomerase family protein [Gammaproteobacteria bacterium]|nr:enoyl-CoA hydratase/isomerase family protein [Gammaproteobacteria bacterium]MBI5614723.1 enoyl-CoA hydratase/isomerase family protein [Gammaproteobacteria bacterium]